MKLGTHPGCREPVEARVLLCGFPHYRKEATDVNYVRPPVSAGGEEALAPPFETCRTCPWCGVEVPERDWPDHAAGRDATRLRTCGHQDLETVRATHEPRTGLLRVRW